MDTRIVGPVTPRWSLAHDYVLLALDERGSWLVRDLVLRHVTFAGALIAELLQRDRLVAVEAHRFAIRSGRSDGLYGRVEDLLRWRKPYKLDTFLNHLASRGKRLLDQVCAELVEEGVLRRERDRIWFVTWRTRHPVADRRTPRELISRLRAHVAGADDETPPLREDALLSLLRVSKLYGSVWTEAELSALEPHLGERTDRAPIGRDVRRVVMALQAAAAGAVVAAVS